MKSKILGVLVLIGFIGGISYFFGQSHAVVEYKKEYVTEEVVKEVDPIDSQIKKRNAELEEKYRKIQNLEATLDVLKAERDRVDAEIVSTQKELAGFTIVEQ